MSSLQINLIGFKHIAEGLRNNNTLLSLDISNNYLGPQVAKHLLYCIPLCSLEILNLSKSKLGDAGIKNISSLFSPINENKIRVSKRKSASWSINSFFGGKKEKILSLPQMNTLSTNTLYLFLFRNSISATTTSPA